MAAPQRQKVFAESATLWGKREAGFSLLYLFQFWKVSQTVPGRVEAKLLVSRSQVPSPCFAQQGRKEGSCLYLALLPSSAWAKAGRRGWISEGGVFILEQNPSLLPWALSNVAITALTQIVSSLGDYTLIIMLLPEGAHTCKPLCKVELLFFFF